MLRHSRGGCEWVVGARFWIIELWSWGLRGGRAWVEAVMLAVSTGMQGGQTYWMSHLDGS